MRFSEIVAPLGAVATACGTLLCCLPYGFAAATAMAGVSAVVAERRQWFLGASIALLVLGVVQVARAQRACNTRRTFPIAVLILSGVIVVFVILFPQTLATLMADWLP